MAALKARNVPQLLPTVADPVHGTGFVERFIYGLKTGDESQKAGSEAEPQLDQNDDRHNQRFGLQPLDRLQDDAQLNQHAVRYAVAVARKDHQPDEVNVPGDRRRIEDQGHERPRPRTQLIDDPSKQEAGQIADGSCDGGEEKGILQRNQKDIVFQEQTRVIIPTDKPRKFQHVEIRKAENHGNNDRKNGKQREQDHIRRKQNIGMLAGLDLRQLPLPP